MELLAHSALQDFATSSLQVAVSQQNQELQQKSDPLKNYEIVERRRWEQRFVIILQFPKILRISVVAISSAVHIHTSFSMMMKAA